VTSEYQPGGRLDPNGSGAVRGHYGIDYSAPRGAPIYANKPLQVERVGYNYKDGVGWGNYVDMKDPQTGVVHRFAHLDEQPNIKPGQVIKPGESIGYTGESGGSSGPHLHYETLVNGAQKNPRDYHGGVASFSKSTGDLFSEDAIKDKNRPLSTSNKALRHEGKNGPAHDHTGHDHNKPQSPTNKLATPNESIKKPGNIQFRPNPRLGIHDGS
jgi:murein DD-endopeptidase MepM/ murein hydrolase activator NlpD